MAKRKGRTVRRIGRKKLTGRKAGATPKRRPVSGTRTTRKKRSRTKRLSATKRPTAFKKRRAIEEKEREVDEARKRLLHAQALLAAEGNAKKKLTKKE